MKPCPPSGVLEETEHVPIEANSLAAADIDASHGSIAGLRIGMTKDQLIATGYPTIERSVM